MRRKRKVNKHPKWLQTYREDARRSQGSRCKFCHCKLTAETVTADHIEPQSKGGVTRPENIQATCKLCNLLKASMPSKRFMKIIRGERSEYFPLTKQQVVRRIHDEADAACKRILKYAGVHA